MQLDGARATTKLASEVQRFFKPRCRAPDLGKTLGLQFTLRREFSGALMKYMDFGLTSGSLATELVTEKRRLFYPPYRNTLVFVGITPTDGCLTEYSVDHPHKRRDIISRKCWRSRVANETSNSIKFLNTSRQCGEPQCARWWRSRLKPLWLQLRAPSTSSSLPRSCRRGYHATWRDFLLLRQHDALLSGGTNPPFL